MLFRSLLRFLIVLVFAACLLQPIVAFRRTVPEGPPVFVLLDASQSMGLKDSAAPAGRLAEAVQWLEKNGLHGKLAARPNVHWFAFDAHARAVAPDGLAALPANGTTTRYAESLADAWEHYRQQSSADAPLVPGGRVLLVSDGHDFGAREVSEVARQLGLAVDTLAPATAELIESVKGKKVILLTTHRRESFGEAMTGNLKVLRDFIERHSDVHLIFPVHPNPNVRGIAKQILGKTRNIHLLDPLDYSDFLAIMRASWLIVSDSGGVQEEAPSLGKPLLVIRENTERPEAIRAGVSKLVGTSPGSLRQFLEENHAVDTWIRSVKEVANPFGDGRAAQRIVRVIEEKLANKSTGRVAQGVLF